MTTIEDRRPGRRVAPTGARAVTTIGLLAGSAGILLGRAAGVAMPAVPPGLVMMLVAAALVALVAHPWAAAVGAVAGLAEVVGFVVSGAWTALIDVGQPMVLSAAWLRGLGILLALVAGVVAVGRSRRRPVAT